MNKNDLIQRVYEVSGLSKKDTITAVESVFDVITEELGQGGNVQIQGFGGWSVAERSARKGRNPQTGEEIEISESKVPKFKPGKNLKDAVN